ncbi:MAG: hypothetical protein L6R42_000594 [Xanthoria sp. 1 TBL-2021]|nr:MAG: hypothetical protein L6R42_000594 [Xanthoria sp. 1 TBL-2021]
MACQDFVAHFSTLTNDFEADYYVTHRKVIQRPDNWQSLVALAKKQTVLRLVLRSRGSVRRTDSISSSDEEKPSGLKTNLSSRTRSSSPTVAGIDPTGGPDMVEPSPNMSDHKNQMNNAALPGFDNASSVTTKKRGKDTRSRMQVIRVNDFHHFYWLAAASTVQTDKEREGKEGISFTLDKRRLEQSLAQMQTYLQKRSKISRRAYAQCPSHGLNEVEDWAGRLGPVKNEDDGMSRRKKDDWYPKLAQEIKASKDRLAKQMEGRLDQEQDQTEHEHIKQRFEVIERAEGYESAKEKLRRLFSEQLAKKREEKPGRRTESEVKIRGSSSDDPERRESPGEQRSGSRASSSSAGVSPTSPSYEFTNLISETELPDQATANAILKLSKQLFAFFFPITYSSSMTDKYWGGVFWLLHASFIRLAT